MAKPASIAALLGALLTAAPVTQVEAQQVSSFTLKSSPEPATNTRSPEARRIDLLRHREDPFEQPPDLFGIPLTAESDAAKRERGFSFTVRPVKGVRAVARLRF